MNQSTAQRSSRVFCFLGAAILLLAAFPAKAADLVGVRIGLHEKYTRVVLETDARAPCWIESSDGEELVLRLNASSGARVVASKQSPHLASIAVVPADLGVSEIRIALRGPVEVEKLVLSAPHRIVLDLRGEGEAAAPPPTAVEPAPQDAQLAPTAGQPAPSSPLREPVAIPEPAGAPPAPSSEAPLESMPAEPVDPAPEEVEESEEVVAAPAHPEPDPSAVLAAEEAEEPVPAAAETPTLAPPAVVPAQPAAGGGLLDGVPAPLDQPLFLAALALFLVFAIAFAVARRRGAAEAEEPATPFAAGEPFSVDEQPGAAESQEGTEADLPVASAGASQGPSLFDQSAESVDPSDAPQSEEASPDRDGVAVALPVAESAPGADPSQETERRLAQLEERMDEMIDTKDRLGRQIAAQTEELRVQRAAIARTQRMLRDLTRPDDEATEPVPKT